MASTFFKTKGLTTHSWPCLPQLYIKTYISLMYVLASRTTANHSPPWDSLSLKCKWEVETETAVRLNYEADKKPVVTGPNHWRWNWATQAFPRTWALKQTSEGPDVGPGQKNRLERLTHTFFPLLFANAASKSVRVDTYTSTHKHTCAVISNVTQITRMTYSLMLFTPDTGLPWVAF